MWQGSAEDRRQLRCTSNTSGRIQMITFEDAMLLPVRGGKCVRKTELSSEGPVGALPNIAEEGGGEEPLPAEKRQSTFIDWR